MTAAPHDPRLPDDLLRALAQRGGVRSFPAQAVLVNEGDETQSVYIVLSGRVKVYASGEAGREIVLSELGPGEYLGELSIDGEPRSASVMTLESTRCCVIPRAEWEAFLAEHPAFAAHVTRKLMGMVRKLTEQVKALALQDVYSRVARVLTEASEPQGTHRVLRHKLTQQDIADRVGASREMVNRVMKELSAGGYVVLNDAKLLEIRKALPARW